VLDAHRIIAVKPCIPGQIRYPTGEITLKFRPVATSAVPPVLRTADTNCLVKERRALQDLSRFRAKQLARDAMLMDPRGRARNTTEQQGNPI
jgi:hypothetical protein